MGRLLWKDFKELKDTNEYSLGEAASLLVEVQQNYVRTLSVYNNSFYLPLHLMQMKPEASLIKDGYCAIQHLHTRQVITSRGVSFAVK